MRDFKRKLARFFRSFAGVSRQVAVGIGRFLIGYLDDLLILGGIGCISGGGFVLHTAVGLFLLGAGLVGFGILVAKGGVRK